MFENLLKEVFGSKVKIMGNEIIKDLGKNVAHISFKENGYKDRYVMVNVKIINKETLNETSKKFMFNDYLIERIDDRKDYEGDIYIWNYNNKVNWYIALPSKSNLNKLKKDVEDYIKMFKIKEN